MKFSQLLTGKSVGPALVSARSYLITDVDMDVLKNLPSLRSFVGYSDDYLPGSRDNALSDICTWIDESNELVLWLHGAAGVGKSTMMHELVRHLGSLGRLATFTFLALGSIDDAATMVRMMSRELAAQQPDVISDIAKATRNCDSTHASMTKYLTAYLFDPIRSLHYSRSLVIVMDAVDEWPYYEVFLKDLQCHPNPFPLKFIITSRPDPSVERALGKVTVKRYPLDLVSHDVVENYFRSHFTEIEWRGKMPDPAQITRLAALADGLLIWAATVCSLLLYKLDPKEPHERLAQILSSNGDVVGGKRLETLYAGALERLFPEPDEKKLLQDVIGAMMVLQEELPVGDFAQILGMSTYQVEEIASRLKALQTRGTSLSGVILPAIHQFHASFLDFLRSDAISNPLIVNDGLAHSALENACSTVFSAFLPTNEGTNVQSFDLHGIKMYAVKFWALHLSMGSERPAYADTPIQFVALGNFFHNRFKHFGDLADIKSSVTSHQSAVQFTPEGHAEMPSRLCNLGTSFCALFRCTGDVANIESAISYQQKAVWLTPDGHAKMPSFLHSLGDSFCSRFQFTKHLDDIIQAISAYRQSVTQASPSQHLSQRPLPALIPSHVSDRSQSLRDIGVVIGLLCQVASLRQVIHNPHTDLVNISDLVTSVVTTTIDDHEIAATVAAIRLLKLSQVAEQATNNHTNLISMSDLVTSAVAAAIDNDENDTALAWLEQERWLAWNRLCHPVDDLCAHDPFLADRFSSVARGLELLGSPRTQSRQFSETTLVQVVAAQDETQADVYLANEWNNLLSEIRLLPRFRDFLQSPKASNLFARLPQDGPIVIFNIHEDRCDAIALISGAETPLHIPLESFSHRQAVELRDRLGRGLTHGTLRAYRLMRDKRPNLISKILRDMWTLVVKPVLEGLGFSVCHFYFTNTLTNQAFCSSPRVRTALAFGGAQPGPLYSFPSTLQGYTVVKERLDRASPTLLCHRTPRP